MDEQNQNSVPPDMQNIIHDDIISFDELEAGLAEMGYFEDTNFDGEEMPFMLDSNDLSTQGQQQLMQPQLEHPYHHLPQQQHSMELISSGIEPQEQQQQPQQQQQVLMHHPEPMEQQPQHLEQQQLHKEIVHDSVFTQNPMILDPNIQIVHQEIVHDFVPTIEQQQQQQQVNEEIQPSGQIVIEESFHQEAPFEIQYQEQLPEQVEQVAEMEQIIVPEVEAPMQVSELVEESTNSAPVILEPRSISPVFVSAQSTTCLAPPAAPIQTASSSNSNVKYVSFPQSVAVSSSGQNIIFPKPGMVVASSSSTGGQTIFLKNQQQYLLQTPQGPVILAGSPGPPVSQTGLGQATQTVLLPQSSSGKLMSPMLTTINPSMAAGSSGKAAGPIQTATSHAHGKNFTPGKSIFLLAPAGVKAGTNVMAFATPSRLPAASTSPIAIRPKLQKIAPSPTKEPRMNKGSIQIGFQPGNNKNVQFMVLDNHNQIASSPTTSTVPREASAPTSSTALSFPMSATTPTSIALSPMRASTTSTSSAPSMTKMMPIKSTKSPVNLVQLNINSQQSSSKKMLLVPNSGNKSFGTVVQPVAKPGLPPTINTTRVLMSFPRLRTPLLNSTPSQVSLVSPKVLGTVKLENSFRTISGTEANMAANRMINPSVLRPSPVQSFRSFSSGNDEGRRKACNCNRSQCLKLYCECFANGEFCQNCNCLNCCNNLDHEEMRQKAIRFCLERNPNAFHPKIGQKSSDVTHKKGCNCKRSGCLKNYCECYEAKILCTDKCKCCGCKNFESHSGRSHPPAGASMAAVGTAQITVKTEDNDNEAEIISPVWAPDSRVKLPFKVTDDMNPFNLLTDEILESTAFCLLAQREEAKHEGHDEESIQRLTLEMFGDCLNQMFNLDVNKKMAKKDEKN